MTWLLAFLIIAILAALTSIVASPGLRGRFIGESRFLNAAVPLVAAGLAWAATQTGGVVRNIVGEGSVPPAVLDVFVEEVSFGLPVINDLYKQRRLNGSDLEGILRPFRELDETVSLTESEAEQINRVAIPSGMASQVNPGRTYGLSEVASFVERPLGFYFEYTQWGPRTVEWSTRLRDSVGEVANEQIVRDFIDSDLESYVESGGIFHGIVGMLDRGDIEVTVLQDDCSPTPVIGVSLEEIEQSGQELLVLDFGRFSMPMASLPTSQRRQERATKLRDLFAFACPRSLGILLQLASKIYEREVAHMGRYVQLWNQVLADRKSSRLAATVTIANLGKYNAFVRRAAPVIVGAEGEDDASRTINLTLAAADLDNDSEYIRIASRDVVQVVFSARLSDEEKERLFHSYASGLTYMKLAILASSGADRSVAYSDLTPFSAEAKTKAEGELVDRVKLRL